MLTPQEVNNKTFPKADFEAGLVIKKGKKVFHKAIV